MAVSASSRHIVLTASPGQLARVVLADEDFTLNEVLSLPLRHAT